jgi:hypothetical protein
MIITLVTILFWTLPALPIVIGVYGYHRGHRDGYNQACAEYSIAKAHTSTKEESCDKFC